jgi:Flp pilus assembly protein TadD
VTPARALSLVRPVREDHLGASTYIEKGWHFIAHGDFAAAEKSLTTALELAPSETRAKTLLGWAIMRQSRYDDALEILDQALGEDPGNALARACLGYVCMRKGMLPEAHEHMNVAAAQMRDPKAALYGCFYLGLLYSRQRDLTEAERYFERTLSRSGMRVSYPRRSESGRRAIRQTGSTNGASVVATRSGSPPMGRSRAASAERRFKWPPTLRYGDTCIRRPSSA